MSHTHPRFLRRTAVVVAAALVLVLAACSGSPAAGSAPSAVASSASAKDPSAYANPDKLVSPDWLAAHTSDINVVIVDLRKKDAYDAGHIPGAFWSNTADWTTVDSDGVKGQIASGPAISSILSKAGAKPDTTLVFYDDQADLWAARALWTVEVYGHKDTRLLNGGWTAWSAQGKATTKDAPQRAATQYAFSGPPNTQIIANRDEVTKALGDGGKLLVDARTAEEYAGRDVRSKLGGHVPGAKNISYTEAVDKNSQFLTAPELRRLYDGIGIKSNDSRTIYTYCQTGVRAAHTWFVLRYLVGEQNVKVYDGSWEDWGNRTDTKIETSR